MRKSAILLFILLSVSVVSSGCALSSKVRANTKQLKELEAQADAMEVKIAHLGEKIGDIEEKISSLSYTADQIEMMRKDLEVVNKELKRKLEAHGGGSL